MAIIISIFNNKGGVGKTTYLYHVAHLLERRGKTVLMVDADSQCNLTAYSLPDATMERSWRTEGNSIWRIIEPVYQGLGNFRRRVPIQVNSEGYPHLYLVPGDLLLSNYEDRLGDSWSGAKGGNEPELRIQSAIYRYILWAAQKLHVDVVMVDLGPNLGALNRAVLAASDYFIVPISPDLFSIRGTENLGEKLTIWNQEWGQCNTAWRGQSLDLPKGGPVFLGYVTQQHNIRQNEQGMTRGWQIFGERVEASVRANIIDRLLPLNQVYNWGQGTANLGRIPNMHSLIPYSLEAKKPIFDCTAGDGLTGAHITRAREADQHFVPIVDRLMELL